EVLQTLLVALMHLEAGADPADANASANANADAADVHVRDAIAALRRVMDDIQPLELEHLDDAAALELAATRVEEAWDVHVDRHIDVTSVLSPEHRLLAYRVAHEALSVSVKLAHASSISLSAQDIDGGFELCVADDGRGLGRRIDIEDAHVPEFGTGLNLLLEQVIAAGGRCAVSSAPDTGTAMSITLPVVRPAAPVAPLKRG
ncbi:MAG: histidine kinase, partial [Thermoleophilia bacterium]|nr:histidine kinase [Thermoleophilia bacterium]